MASLFVNEQGARVVRKEGKVCVTVADSELKAIHPQELTQCVLIGNVGISTPAVKMLLKEGVDVVFLSAGGRFIGRLSSGLSKNGLLRLSQYRFLTDDARALSLSKICVAGKIENQRRLLRRYQKRRGSTTVSGALVALRHALGEIEKAINPDSLRGIEGQAAVRYFSCWNDLLTQDGIRFEKRIRRPPTDPVNVLLSFGYTVLGNLIHSMVDAAGLDPYLGALHTPRYGRPSLVLDLIEEFRPVIVDASVMRAINTRTVTSDDFENVTTDITASSLEAAKEEYLTRDGTDVNLSGKGELRFKRSGIRKWVAQIERRLNETSYFAPREQTMSLRDIIRAQVYRFADHILEKATYSPYGSPE